MTDRDPNYRDPSSPAYRDPMNPSVRNPNLTTEGQSWSMGTWGWIGGIAIVALILAVMFSSSNTPRTASQPTNPPSTVGQRTIPPAAPQSEAPTLNRPLPAPMTPAPAPAPATPPAQP